MSSSQTNETSIDVLFCSDSLSILTAYQKFQKYCPQTVSIIKRKRRRKRKGKGERKRKKQKRIVSGTILTSLGMSTNVILTKSIETVLG